AGEIAACYRSTRIFDYEAPNGATSNYRARAYSDTYQTWSDWATDSDDWSSSDWWLKHNSRPSLNLKLRLKSYPGWQETSNQGVCGPLGSSEPVVGSAARGPVTGQIEVFTTDQDERDDLAATLALQVPMLLQGPVAADIPERWVVFGDSTTDRLVDT